MRGAWYVDDIRAAEERLMATVPEGTLMQRAATGLATHCARLLGKVYGQRVVLLVGGGNNGGDALFAGAQLRRRGALVRAVLLAPEKVHAGGLAALRAAGGEITSTVDLYGADLVLDGIVGIGAKGALRGAFAEAAATASTVDGYVVAVDVPSGVDVDTGAVEGPVVRADLTVTFGALKPALVVGPAAPLAGVVETVDIGLSIGDDPALWVPDRDDIAAWWPVAGATSDKYTRGVVGLATGSPHYPGAALLSVLGALAGPSGMVRYAGPLATDVVHAHPSVVTSPSVAEAGRVQAWLVGSGLGTDDRALGELRAVLAAPVPVVIDADALTLSGDPAVADLIRDRAAPTVVTPHDREYARLAGDVVGGDRVDAARRLAQRLGVVVLLKGDRTIVASPEGPAWVNPTGTPALATAGSGDVLAGLLASLLAAGVPAQRAAVAGAYVHGLAGQFAAAGPDPGALMAGWPVTAPTVANSLPSVIGSLLRGY